jgi:hypothetical protein
MPNKRIAFAPCGRPTRKRPCRLLAAHSRRYARSEHVTSYLMLVASIALITALPTIAADAPPVDDSAMWAHLELMAEPQISRADALSLAEKHVISKGFDVRLDLW